MMQVLEFLAGCGLLLGAVVAAQHHKHAGRRAGVRLVGIAMVATMGALLLTMPLRDLAHEQRAALQVRR